MEKETTVLVKGTYDELHNNLNKQGFKIIDEYQLDDIYMAPKELNFSDLKPLDILKSCILIRNVDDKKKKIMYKYKKYADNGDIIEQNKVQCDISNVYDAKVLFESINYIQLFEIKNHSYVYANNKFEITVQLVNNKYIFIEMEDKNESTNKYYSTIEEMIKDFKTIYINYDESSYFDGFIEQSAFMPFF